MIYIPKMITEIDPQNNPHTEVFPVFSVLPLK